MAAFSNNHDESRTDNHIRRTLSALQFAMQDAQAQAEARLHAQAARAQVEKREALQVEGAAFRSYFAAIEAAREAARLAELEEAEAMLHHPVYIEAEAISKEPAPAPSLGTDYEAYIYEVAAQYGQDPAALIRVMYCESSGNPYADNGVCKGLFQFHPGTWASTPEGAAGASIWDGYAQIRMAAWMWSAGRRGEWSCQ